MVFAGLVLASLAGCARPAVPPPDTAAAAAVSGFAPYCGPVWSVARQGYVLIPCPPGSGYLRADPVQ
jgi:hypothetical protein